MAYTNIDDPSAYFQTLLWTGNDVDGRALTNDGNSDLQPDLVWLKNRNVGYNHFLVDSSRGTSVYLSSNTTTADTTWTNLVESFDTDGFTVGDDGSQVPNHTGNTFVAWQWKANGGTTSSNTNGTITSTIQANTDAGFNIVTYTGNGANSNFAHGMGEQPDMVIVKNRTSAANWCVWHKDLTSSYYMQLDTTISQQTGPWDGLNPNSGVVFIYSGGLVNASGSNYVAYIFKGKQGYSKFGKYVGNGNSNGPFVYTGFKPAWVMVKQSNTARSWQIFDNKRDGYNKDYMPRLQADSSSAEAANTGASMDFLSNGFKIRTDQTGANQSGGTYIYMAFAENPFTTSTGVPCTAR